jgi:hypothetical protein
VAGLDGIPEWWRKALVKYEMVEEYAQKRAGLSEETKNQ